MRVVIAALMVVALAGCGKSEEAGNNSSDGAATAQAEQPANLTEDQSNTLVPIAKPSPSPLASLPAAYLGRWGMVDKDCDPKLDYAAKGLMVVAPGKLTFYEARATIGRIDTTLPGTVSVALSYSGEGQNWADTETLTLVDPQTLVRESTKPAGSFRYTRCPA